MTNKDAAFLVVSENQGQFVHYKEVSDQIQGRQLSPLSGKTPENTVNRDLRQLVKEGRIRTIGWGTGEFYLPEVGNSVRQMSWFAD